MPPMSGKPAYWRSLEELEGSDAFRDALKRSHPNQEWNALPPATRRQFLQLMGASMALAGLAGCRWPKENIVPFARPAGYMPGVPERYATALETAGVATGVLVTSYDGRPIKVEGNPSHPLSRGATDAFAQAAILELYDPSRSRALVRRDAERLAPSWEDFAGFARTRLERGGAGFRVLAEASSSPSLARLREKLLATYPGTRWYEYEPLGRDTEREGARLAFGRPLRTHLALDRAAVIVCLDADPLMTHPSAVRHARDFASGRKPENGSMSRLYSLEAIYSVTGTVADHRYAVPSSEIAAVAAHLALALSESGAIDPSFAPALAGITAGAPRRPFVETIARDLMANRGRGVVVAGERQPAEVHALTHVLNAALGNAGQTVRYTEDPEPARVPHAAALASLASEMRSGAVETLLVIGGNPVYDAPEFGAAMEKAGTSIHLSLFENETSRKCGWHLPRAHAFESWGDARADDGTVSIVQPLIEPLYDGRTPVEVLSMLVDPGPWRGYNIVRETFAQASGGVLDETSWRKALEDGVVPGSAYAEVTPAPTGAHLGEFAGPAKDGGLELILTTDHKVHDGRFANNAWLQELPDPITKVVWNNPALIAPATAEELGVRSDDVVAIKAGEREIELPALIVPGQAPGTVAVALGYGRTAAGEVGNGVGANAYALLATSGAFVVGGATVRRTGRRHVLATTQSHHIIDRVGQESMQKRSRQLVREANIEEFRRHPEFVHGEEHERKDVQLYDPPVSYGEGHQWGMAIDLNSCTGCSACVVACQAENNIPVVGEDQVRRGREMHWIRIDRYFQGEPDDARVAHQPMMCVHCENAPCEQVCPVTASVHSAEGLNEQVYNRCIGTRYCANNCPYKVRRFNWFNFHKDLTQIEKMAFNPEVTVRGRGVMEKCTYCVQRIEGVKIAAIRENRPIADGEVVPACAQACPTRAIVFGDLNDPESEVRRLHRNSRAYEVLGEINTRPRTRYLGKVTNPAGSEIAGAAPAHGAPSGEAPGHGAPAHEPAPAGGHRTEG